MMAFLADGMYVKVNLAFILVYLHLPGQVQSLDVKIGGIFSNGTISSNEDYIAFSTAVDFINTEEKHSGKFGFTLVKDVEFVDVEDELENMMKAIALVDRGAVAIVGPTEVSNVEAIQRLCPELQTPQLAPLVSGIAQRYNPCNFEYLLRMSPNDGLLFHAVADVIGYLNWTQVSVLASRDTEGRAGMSAFRELLYLRRIKIFTSEYFHLDPRVTRYSLRRVLDRIKSVEAQIVVLKCSARYVRMVLEEAAQKDMIEKWVWILVDSQLDEAHLIIKGTMPEMLQGLIGVRQSIGQGPYNKTIFKYWKETGRKLPTKPSAGRIIDSVLVLAEAVRLALKDGVKMSEHRTGNICSNTTASQGWNVGTILSRYLRKVRVDGFMDKINFNNEGSAVSGFYDVVNLYNNQVTKVGEWRPTKLKMFKDKKIVWGSDGSTEIPRDSVNALANKTITIVTFKSPPFTIPKRPNATGIQSPEDFQGAVIDLINRLKQVLHFDYVIYMSPDRKVGNANKVTGHWGGVIGEVARKNADMAIGPITITSHRSKVVDFTHPFMTSGLGVVMATEEISQTYFGFLKPFHEGLWVAIIGSVVGMAVVSWLFSTLSPNGFYGRCVHGLKSEVLPSHHETKSNLSLLNAIWSSAAYFLGQGPDGLHPVSASGRASTAVWWFCVTILASTYTANLAAYLTTNRMQTPIKTVQDLSQQNEIDYGLIANSQTQKFFEDSHVSRYQIMWEYMKLRRALVSNTSAGIKRVLQGNYGFIHDAPVLQYLARKKHCGQMKLIGGFDHGTIGQMNYGFALHKNSPFKTLINVELLKMQHNGEIKNFVNKWMVEKTPCPPLDDLNREETSTDTSKMGVMNMLGVFVFMIAGVIVGFLLLILEWFVAALGDYYATSSRHLPLTAALANRLRRQIQHIKNPRARKLDKSGSTPFRATKATQTTNQQSSTNNQTLMGYNISETSRPNSTDRYFRRNGRRNAFQKDKTKPYSLEKETFISSNTDSSRRPSIKV